MRTVWAKTSRPPCCFKLRICYSGLKTKTRTRTGTGKGKVNRRRNRDGDRVHVDDEKRLAVKEKPKFFAAGSQEHCGLGIAMSE